MESKRNGIGSDKESPVEGLKIPRRWHFKCILVFNILTRIKKEPNKYFLIN